MPELPEVEFARACLERWLKGEQLLRATAAPSRVLRGSSPRALAKLSGHRVEGVERRGKQLLVRFDEGWGLLAHLGMTGKFVLVPSGEKNVRWTRAAFTRASDGGTVHYVDPRMFGRLVPGKVTELREQAELAALGPDALDAPPAVSVLAEAFSRTTRTVKETLMDQRVLAGIGNIQATEALFRARILPGRSARSLDRTEIGALLRAIRWTLRRSLSFNEGDTITYVEEPNSENPFVIYRHEGEPCPRCGKVLVKDVIGGRGSVFCRGCQR